MFGHFEHLDLCQPLGVRGKGQDLMLGIRCPERLHPRGGMPSQVFGADVTPARGQKRSESRRHRTVIEACPPVPGDPLEGGRDGARAALRPGGARDRGEGADE